MGFEIFFEIFSRDLLLQQEKAMTHCLTFFKIIESVTSINLYFFSPTDVTFSEPPLMMVESIMNILNTSFKTVLQVTVPGSKLIHDAKLKDVYANVLIDLCLQSVMPFSSFITYSWSGGHDESFICMSFVKE